MKIPNFLTDEGSILYKNTVGKQISPKVGEIVIQNAEKLFNEKTKRVLDVACGPGTVALSLARKHPEIQITGIDSSAAMIRQCLDVAEQEKLQNTDFIEMNADVIQFQANTFDFAVCNLAFPFFSNPQESMRGINTALNPGAPIVISVPGRNTWKEFFEVAESILGDALKFAKPFLTKFNQAEKLPAAMEQAGFKNLKVTAHLIPFSFNSGNEVLAFFQELFSLLSYVPDEIKSGVSEAIDARFPDGFTMHYEAVIIQALSAE